MLKKPHWRDRNYTALGGLPLRSRLEQAANPVPQPENAAKNEIQESTQTQPDQPQYRQLELF